MSAQVHDVSPEEGEGANFELLEAVDYWEVPIQGGPPPDNPVPDANGKAYSGGGATTQAAASSAAVLPSPVHHA